MQALEYLSQPLKSFVSRHRQYANEWVWPHSNKTLFTKTGSGPWAIVCQPLFQIMDFSTKKMENRQGFFFCEHSLGSPVDHCGWRQGFPYNQPSTTSALVVVTNPQQNGLKVCQSLLRVWGFNGVESGVIESLLLLWFNNSVMSNSL